MSQLTSHAAAASHHFDFSGLIDLRRIQSGRFGGYLNTNGGIARGRVEFDSNPTRTLNLSVAPRTRRHSNELNKCPAPVAHW